MQRVLEQGLLIPHFHQGAQVHNAQTVADVAHHGKVMGNEQA